MKNILLILLLSWLPCAAAQKATSKGVVIPCRETINSDVSSIPNFGELTAEKLTEMKRELTDCVMTERRLSSQDFMAAYKVQEAEEIEIGKRVMDIASKQQADYDNLKDHGKEVAELFIKTDKQYRELIDQYNGLVGKYNSMLDTYRANVSDSIRFGNEMKQLLDAQTDECGNAVRGAMQTLPIHEVPAYKPLQPTHCTTHTIGNPISGNWTYTDCN